MNIRNTIDWFGNAAEKKKKNIEKQNAKKYKSSNTNITFNFHKKVKEVSVIFKKSNIALLDDKNEKIINGLNKKLEIWQAYIRQL